MVAQFMKVNWRILSSACGESAGEMTGESRRDGRWVKLARRWAKGIIQLSNIR